ncbi:hypothetical protein HPB47_006401 [Ixodes persulcatus]|uniref:Uncharacterized protein n=1 Tax=Ixodes persulcatus TaxID=34615 RepID=A0AC60PA84_IXOPE|nr:hypothetical protein HPB47_006401 [Ixodes persulcatus]
MLTKPGRSPREPATEMEKVERQTIRIEESHVIGAPLRPDAETHFSRGNNRGQQRALQPPPPPDFTSPRSLRLLRRLREGEGAFVHQMRDSEQGQPDWYTPSYGRDSPLSRYTAAPTGSPSSDHRGNVHGGFPALSSDPSGKDQSTLGNRPFNVEGLPDSPNSSNPSRGIDNSASGSAWARGQAGGGAVIPQELPAQRHYLVIVNPKSGPGRSLEIFLHRVRPILAEADISHLLLVTERQNHAKEFIKSLNLKQWSGILVISGDGLLFEVYNGLMERPDWEQAVKIPIGIIPGGSGNGLARSISHTANEPYVSDPIVAATLGVAKGRISPLDLMLVETPKGALYSFLTVGWGIMADIDIESERLRAIGEIRFTLWAFWRVFNLRTYQGRISYLPATVPPKNGVPPSTASAAPKNPAPQTSNSSASNDRRPASVPANNGGLHRSQSAPEGYANLNQSQEELADGDNVLPAELEVVADSSMTRAPEPTVAETPLAPPDGFPSLDDPVPDDWTVEEGRFIIIYSSLQSHLGTNLFFAPEARLDDGVAWLLMIRGDATRLQLLTYFKAQEEGHHVDLPYVRLIPVRAFRLEAFANSTVTVDGELVRTKLPKQPSGGASSESGRVVSPASVVELEEMTKENFLRLGYSDRPIVLRGAARRWKAMAVFSFAFFRELYRNVSDSFKNNRDYCQFFKYKTEFEDLEDFLRMPDSRADLTDPEAKTWYVGWSNCDQRVAKVLREYYTRPEFLPQDSEASVIDWIFMGYSGNGATTHLDYVQRPSWQAQIRGSKTWTLVPPPECEEVCVRSLTVTVRPGDLVMLNTNRWYHGTWVEPGDLSITIGSEYD